MIVPIYTINADSETGAKSITCHRCNMTSHNPRDVINAYCDNCQMAFDMVWPPALAKWVQGGPDKRTVGMPKISRPAAAPLRVLD